MPGRNHYVKFREPFGYCLQTLGGVHRQGQLWRNSSGSGGLFSLMKGIFKVVLASWSALVSFVGAPFTKFLPLHSFLSWQLVQKTVLVVTSHLVRGLSLQTDFSSRHVYLSLPWRAALEAHLSWAQFSRATLRPGGSGTDWFCPNSLPCGSLRGGLQPLQTSGQEFSASGKHERLSTMNFKTSSGRPELTEN